MGQIAINTTEGSKTMSHVYITYTPEHFDILKNLEEILKEEEIQCCHNKCISIGESLENFKDEFCEAKQVIAIIDYTYFTNYECMHEISNVFIENPKGRLYIIAVENDEISLSTEKQLKSTYNHWEKIVREAEKELKDYPNGERNSLKKRLEIKKQIRDSIDIFFSYLFDYKITTISDRDKQSANYKNTLFEIIEAIKTKRDNATNNIEITSESLPDSSILYTTTQTNQTGHSSELTENRVQISYNHNSKPILEYLIEKLSTESVDYMYDQIKFETNQDIQDYAYKIGISNLVIALIGEEYLKSTNCMRELLRVYQNGNLTKRLYYISIASNNFNLFDKSTAQTMYEYWDSEFIKGNNKAKNVPALENLEELNLLKETQNIKENIKDIINQLARIYSNSIELSIEQCSINTKQKLKISKFVKRVKTKQNELNHC